jgi:hypothetical protein
MSIKFEGKPPFYLGIAEVASAHALDGSVVLRATISVPELRPKSVPVQFILAIDVVKALAEQLPIAVRTAELQKQQGVSSRRNDREARMDRGCLAAPKPGGKQLDTVGPAGAIERKRVAQKAQAAQSLTTYC